MTAQNTVPARFKLLSEQQTFVGEFMKQDPLPHLFLNSGELDIYFQAFTRGGEESVRTDSSRASPLAPYPYILLLNSLDSQAGADEPDWAWRQLSAQYGVCHAGMKSPPSDNWLLNIGQFPPSPARGKPIISHAAGDSSIPQNH